MKMFTDAPNFWRDRFQASAIHLGLSAAVAALAGLLVFAVWYPYPYREISGGRELFLLVVTVDMILGPLITLAVFNRTKPWSELRRDLLIVALIQLAALSYGLWTVFVARPVHLVFEIDRFRVVHAIEIDPGLLAKAPAEYRALPLWGPTLVALRPFKDERERGDATLAALQGVALGRRADLWEPYENARVPLLKEAKRVSVLLGHLPAQAATIEQSIRAAGYHSDALVYLPLVGRKSFWTAFIDPMTLQIVTTIPVDPY
jgi:hypothetical protein